MKKLSQINESIWSDMQDRSTGVQVRKEDELPEHMIHWIQNHLKSMVNSYVYFEKSIPSHITIDDFKYYIQHNYWFTDKDEKAMFAYVQRNWNQNKNFNKEINTLFNDELKKIDDIGFKKEPSKSICQTLDDWWSEYDDPGEILFDILGFDEEPEDKWDEIWDDCVDWEQKLKIYVDKTN